AVQPEAPDRSLRGNQLDRAERAAVDGLNALQLGPRMDQRDSCSLRAKRGEVPQKNHRALVGEHAVFVADDHHLLGAQLAFAHRYRGSGTVAKSGVLQKALAPDLMNADLGAFPGDVAGLEAALVTSQLDGPFEGTVEPRVADSDPGAELG